MMNNAVFKGFNDKVFDSQDVFRAVLKAMAQPGQVVTVSSAPTGPSPLMPVTAGIALSLFDHATPLWLSAQINNDAVRRYIAFHSRCPLTAQPVEAAFAILDGLEVPANFDEFAQGTPEYPDRSTTLIVQVGDLQTGSGCCLSGPGIDTNSYLNVSDVTDHFWASMARNANNFPLGVDVILTAGNRLAALPRTTKVKDAACM